MQKVESKVDFPIQITEAENGFILSSRGLDYGVATKQWVFVDSISLGNFLANELKEVVPTEKPDYRMKVENA